MPLTTAAYICTCLLLLAAIMWRWQRPQRLVLRTLYLEPRGMTVDAIVQKSKVPKSKIYPILLKLKADGLVESYDVRTVRLYKPTRLL